MEDRLNSEKIRRVDLVFSVIREVGRLLVRENDPDRLIRGICDILVERQGYYNAWIGLFDRAGNIDRLAASGSGRGMEFMRERLGQGCLTHCIQKALKSGEIYAVHNPEESCDDCVLAESAKDRGAIAVALSYEQHRYGFMVLSIPRGLAMDPEERSIVREVADDIAMGLYRMDLEQSRSRSQARFKTLIDNSLNYISILQNGEIVHKSPGLRQIHQLMDHVFEPPDFSKVYEGDRKRIRQAYEDLVQGRISNLETDFQYYPQPLNEQDEASADEGLRWAMISARRIDYLGVESVLTNIMDITDSKEVENFLRIQDKMTSLGRVTAGIAHEIRNPLSGIYIYLKAMKQIYNQMGDIARVLSIIDKIEQASDKIESIIQRVMDFSKPTRPKFVMTNLNHYIDEVTKLTAVTLRKSSITLEKNLDPALPQCWAEPHLIEQVILNLVTNSAEAMKEFEGEKKITLATSLNPAGDVIRIWVIDTGPGIPHAHQSKIFDPFYTTKANSSGIGLSICHRIIRDHGGILRFSGAGGKGAQFLIELPVTPPGRTP